MREEVYRKMNERRMQDKDDSIHLFNALLKNDTRWQKMQGSIITVITSSGNWAGLIIPKKIVSSFMKQ